MPECVCYVAMIEKQALYVYFSLHIHSNYFECFTAMIRQSEIIQKDFSSIFYSKPLVILYLFILPQFAQLGQILLLSLILYSTLQSRHLFRSEEPNIVLEEKSELSEVRLEKDEQCEQVQRRSGLFKHKFQTIHFEVINSLHNFSTFFLIGNGM